MPICFPGLVDQAACGLVWPNAQHLAIEGQVGAGEDGPMAGGSLANQGDLERLGAKFVLDLGAGPMPGGGPKKAFRAARGCGRL